MSRQGHLYNLGTRLETAVRNPTEIISRFELMAAHLGCFLRHLKVHFSVCAACIPTHHTLLFGAVVSGFECRDTERGFLS